MGETRPPDPPAWDGVFDEAFVAAGRREPSAEERVATAQLIARAQAAAQPRRAGPELRRGDRGAGPRRRRQVLGVVLVAALVAALVAWTWRAARPGTPLGHPAPAPAGEGGYAFSAVLGDGRPVAFDPCRPVPYVVRTEGQPPSGPAVLASALAEVSRATGLVFADRGTTEESPDLGSDRLGSRPAGEAPPVLVAWSTAAETPELAGEVAGAAAPVQIAPAGADSARYVTGQVVLDAEDLAHAPGDLGGEDAVRVVLLHELGHLVGLDHVPDPAQLMSAETGLAAHFADGDLRGLHELGLGDCH